MREHDDEDRAEDTAEDRAQTADDHHRQVLDQHVEIERLDGDEAGVKGPQRAGKAGHRRARAERQQLVAGGVDAERLRRNVTMVDRHPGSAEGRSQPVHVQEHDCERDRQQNIEPRALGFDSETEHCRRRHGESGPVADRSLVLADTDDDDEIGGERADGEIETLEPQGRKTDQQRPIFRRRPQPRAASPRTAHRHA